VRKSIALSRVQRETPVIRRTSLPVDGDRRSWLTSWRVHAKDRLHVAICEPVEVDDDGDIFERQWINGTRNRSLATRSKHRSHALHYSNSGVARNLIWGEVYVLTSHCNFKTCVNIPHINKTVTDFGGIYTDISPTRRYAPGLESSLDCTVTVYCRIYTVPALL